jgi:hypothetical protein
MQRRRKKKLFFLFFFVRKKLILFLLRTYLYLRYIWIRFSLHFPFPWFFYSFPCFPVSSLEFSFIFYHTRVGTKKKKKEKPQNSVLCYSVTSLRALDVCTPPDKLDFGLLKFSCAFRSEVF